MLQSTIGMVGVAVAGGMIGGRSGRGRRIGGTGRWEGWQQRGVRP